jgi:hypothetical protein
MLLVSVMPDESGPIEVSVKSEAEALFGVANTLDISTKVLEDLLLRLHGNSEAALQVWSCIVACMIKIGTFGVALLSM